MKIKTLQWSIGGGYIRDPEADPASPSSYTRPGLPSILALLQEQQAELSPYRKPIKALVSYRLKL